jgi:Pro-kumamolisin, activation domain/FG-GAP-like repeat
MRGKAAGHPDRRFRYRCVQSLAASLLLIVLIGSIAFAQTPAGRSQPLITLPVDEGNLVVLSGNTSPEATNPANDRGVVNDNLPLDHMMLQLRRPAAQESALETLIEQLHDPRSPNYQHWLTAAQLGTQFGPADSDIAVVTGWLQQKGFTVGAVYPNKMVIDYSGTAGQVRAAFHTEIHNLEVNGVAHIGNVTDPQIPAALAPAVVGIISLHNFKPHPASVHKPLPFDTSGGSYYVTPPDLATIYNFNLVFSAGNTGQGATIYLIEDSNIYTNNNQLNDWATFRAGFGLSVYGTPSFTTIHPNPVPEQNICTDPGVNGADAEAIIDAEYASAAAPMAAIVITTCAATNTTSGLLIAIENLLNGNAQPLTGIVSISYQWCEVNLGAAGNAAVASAYQTGVAAGISIFVAAGDVSAASCADQSTQRDVPAFNGLGVNGLASTPYNVAVGGTDFSDTYSGANGTYWNSINTSNFGSAKSYIPEIPWNTTCGSQLAAMYYTGSSITYGASGFCNGSIAIQRDLRQLWGGSGGPSSCATGAASIPGVVSGTCAGYAKPSWQTGLLGNPADGVRGLPDVSLFASFGPWRHGYVICFSDTSQSGGIPCDGTASGWSYDWGGTSFSAPIWAGILALIQQNVTDHYIPVQKYSTVGNPNYRLYQLASRQFLHSSACDSNAGNAIWPNCTFYDVTMGDNNAPCQQNSPNCYDPDGSQYGVLSTSTSSYAPAYLATRSWDFATGIGTVNVANLVTVWPLGPSVTSSHDFNSDGFSDIVWRDNAGDTAIWSIGCTRSGPFFPHCIPNATGASLGVVPTQWSIAGQRDFDGDGYSDILWRDASGNTSIWFMSGPRVVVGAAVGNIPTTWSVVATGDFDGDGKADFLWEDTSGDVAVWLMNAANVVSSGGLGRLTTINWTAVGVGDFNGDGKTDVLWRDNTGNTAIWIMNGTAVSSSPSIGSIPTNWSVAGTGDFNGDGMADIVWRDNLGNAAVWLMNGASVLSTGGLGNIPTTWSIVQTGDYNGDGMSDLLWRDNLGNTSIWFMNGAAVASSVALGNIPTNWTVQSVNAE